MKNVYKTLIPTFLYPLSRRIYWTAKFIADRIESPGLSRSRYHNLDALKCTTAYNRFGGYCIPLSSRHRPAARKALAHDVYEPRTIKFITAHCGSGDIVHAGAYFGDFLPALEKSLAPTARIWAFEPSDENYRCARITCIINRLNQTELFHAGLGDAEGTAELITATSEGWALGSGSYLDPAFGEGECSPQHSTIPIKTLDNLIPPQRNVSIIHLDTEGYELRALQGALETIRRNQPILVLEKWAYGDIASTGWFDRHIASMGYEYVREIERNQVYVCIQGLDYAPTPGAD